MFKLDKARDEVLNYVDAMKESAAKRNWKKPADWGHFAVDIIREAFRHMGYTLAHIAAVLIVIAVLVWIF